LALGEELSITKQQRIAVEAISLVLFFPAIALGQSIPPSVPWISKRASEPLRRIKSEVPMSRPLFVLSVLLSFSAAAHAEEDNNSADFWQPKCKALLNIAPSPDKLTLVYGGMIMALEGLVAT
jgi:hypothetical protein